MAIKPKKPTPKKKVPAQIRIAKKRTRKKAKKISNFKRNIFVILLLSLVVLLVSFGYFWGQEDTREAPLESGKYIESYSTEELLSDLSKIKTKVPDEKKETINKKIMQQKVVINKKKTVETPALVERGKEIEIKQEPAKTKNIALAYRGKKPRLVIIIDDVHTKKQMKAIAKLGMKITPSIFPPYQLSKHSNILAKNEKNYMIHLPMESSSKQFNKQTKTLMTSFSDERIADRVMEIRQLFPHAKYVNNHTGSVFTSHYKAMKKLYIALKMEGFVFVDSFTVASSKVRKIAHEFDDAYVRRDIFIDNIHKVSYIHKQLKKAVKKAKKNGYAIAIGHPHKITMKALKSASNILNDVELVYIDAIYKRK